MTDVRERLAQALFVADEGPNHVDEWWARVTTAACTVGSEVEGG